MTNIVDRRQADSTSVDLEIVIEAPAETVFEFLLDPDKVVRWMGSETQIESNGVPGGTFRYRYPNGDCAAGTYGEIRRPDIVTMHWGWEGNDSIPPGSSVVRFELIERDGHTVVHLRHTDLPDARAAVEHTEGWTYYGGRLTVAAAGGDPDAPEPHDTAEEES